MSIQVDVAVRSLTDAIMEQGKRIEDLEKQARNLASDVKALNELFKSVRDEVEVLKNGLREGKAKKT